MTLKNKQLTISITKYTILCIGAVIMLLPFIWMLSTSLKPANEILAWPPEFIPKTLTLDNYKNVFETAPFVRFFVNSMILATVSTFSILGMSTLSGYIFGKFNFPGKNLLFLIILSSAMVPLQTYMVPLYLSMVKLKLVNTYLGLVAPYLVMSFGIFFMRQNVIASLHDDLLNAARIDGANEFTIFRIVVLPVLQGPCGALAIFSFMQSWASFIWPLIIASTKDMWTMEVGLGMFQHRFSVEMGPINAGSMLSLLPILIVFLSMSRHIIRGVALSGLKG